MGDGKEQNPPPARPRQPTAPRPLPPVPIREGTFRDPPPRRPGKERKK